MASRSLLLVVLTIGLCSAWMEERPILETQDGNLVIASAKDRNITLLTFGQSTVNINDINLVDVSMRAHDAARIVETWENGHLRIMTRELNRISDLVDGSNGMLKRLRNLELGLDTNFTSKPGKSRGVWITDPLVFPGAIRNLTRRVRSVERSLNTMRGELLRDGCASSPCKHGGTCIRLYNGHQCLCPPNWEGANCNDDVNECDNFIGTDLGCQNQATCRNLPGSYRCECTTGWHGVHCRSKSNACDAQDSRELCGFGTCLPKTGSPFGYTCLCDPGWQSSATDPACTIDVDECAGNHPACSMNPFVPCLNVPGSFRCASCPPGYTGNGHYCTDINECEIDNGGCSLVPRVQCINTFGSSNCGLCPTGYQGNGKTCTYVGLCGVNNGGCHPLATCVENSNYNNLYPQCTCPSGYHGHGVGPQGCVPGADSTSPCANNPCVHGTCHPNGAHYTCRCNAGFTGTLCDAAVNPCIPNPCLNDGVCKSSDSQTITCECTSTFKGPRCETQREDCGGLFKNPSGVLEFPTAGGNYAHDLNCAFVIITNTSKVLNISISRFGFEKSDNCRYDFFQIHDGANAGAHQLGRFCGNTLPLGGHFVTTHNAVYLWVRTDSSNSNKGFSLRWNAVPPTCGGALSGEHGRINSPGSPGKYPSNRDCYWEVSVNPAKRIQFHFYSVMIEEHPTCENDYLEINETTGGRSTQLGLYCNHTHPKPLTTPGSRATLHFHSDGAGTDMGFQIVYTAIEGTPGCGGIFTAPKGTITSPGFPSSYGYRQLCDWKIQLPKGERLRLTWTSFELETHGYCAFDYVKVFAGPDTSSPIVGTYCGKTLPGSVTIDSNEVLIVFKSDGSNEYKGFQLEYETICGGQFHEASGTIQSPYYPNSYPASRTCIYEIIQPPTKSIVLTVVDMDIESSFMEACYFDSLAIYDGDNDNSTRLGLLCGDSQQIPSEPFYSTHNYMYLKFVTDSSMNNHGFLANYTTVDRKCGGMLKDSTGVIQSHTGGASYDDNEHCVWTIKAPAGHIVQLTFTSFNLELGYHCLSDYVIVYDGPSTTGQEMGRFCGSTLPPPLMSQTESMSIVFNTDSNINGEGFVAHYVFIDASKVCGGHYYSETGVISSPNYPEPYPANRECVWVITAPNKHQINLEAVEFELEESSRCTYDYLEVRNGGYETSPLIGRYCGSTLPSIKSLTNELYIKLVTDSSRHMGGFSLSWDSSTSGCGGTLSGYRGEITSPNYPQPYSRLASCLWKIAVSAGSRIQLIMVDFDVEDHSNCRYDYVEFTSGAHDPRKKPTRYCGTSIPPYIDVDSNIVSIRFRSDYTNSGRGFHIKYETLCANKIRGFDGIIESPNFPNDYPPSINCSWTIEAPLGNTLNLTFSHFDLESSGRQGCTDDYLTIKAGEGNEPNTDLGKFCGSDNLPGRISSTQNQVFLNFVTDGYINNGGFRLEWIVVGCGGHLTSPRGEITSPGYPHGYKETMECEWLIEVDFDQSVEITFDDVNTEKLGGCRFDKVTLYGGADESAPKLIELCHIEKPVKFTSPTNKLFVKFVSDFSFSGRGFKATYKTVDILCGGHFSASAGLIHSTNYPFDYPNNQNCEWLIEVDKNHVVNFTFTDFDIEDTTNCTDDYVKVFDGPTREDTELGTFCKNVLPEPIISTGNSILVVMRSDSLLTAKGFKANFGKACGARIIAKDSGTLETSSTLHMDDSSMNCTWTIIAEDPADHVTLSFYHMDLSYSWENECTNHYVALYEGEGINSGSELGKWCSNKTPLPVTSTGNALTVHLYSEYGFTDERFGAVYSVLNSACGGEYRAVSGTLASPMYPQSYPVNAECIWQLKVAPGNRISLSFSQFNIETSPNCDRDYLEIREKSGIGRLIGIYCNELPAPVEASDELWIKFRSDETGTASGFLGEYSLVHGNDLTGVSGEIASPLYPLPWKLEAAITWRITVDAGMAVRIEFDSLHIENYGSDCYSRVAIYDGYNEDAPELSSLCGISAPEQFIVSSSNVVNIQFIADVLREGNWFHLRWYQTPRLETSGNTEEDLPNCVYEYNLSEASNLTEFESVFFNSTGWPDGYANNLDCSWIFMTVPGYHLRLRFSEIDLEVTQGCTDDYLAIYDGRALPSNRQDLPLLNKFCHSNETSVITIGKSVMTVNFRTDFYQNKTGFIGQIWRYCGGELFGPNGVIVFNNTLHTCEWNITVKAGKTISINFPIFEFHRSEVAGCKDNYVLLKNGEGPHSPLLGEGKYCGQKAIPSSLETTSNKLYVKVVVSLPREVFKMEYKEVGMACGGSYTLGASVHDQVQFNSPNYPNIPPPFTECTWTFRATHGERLSLHFIERFDLASSMNCSREYVEVRDGGTEFSKLMGRFCRDTAPSSMTTNSDMLHVRYYTDLADPKNGFKAAVTSGQVCGGILRGKHGVIKSPNYPATYPIDEVCGWWIAAPPEHTLKLEFRDLHLPSLRRCANTDNVGISERLPHNDTPIMRQLSGSFLVNPLGRWCGSSKPDIPQTSSNEVIVAFHSDNRTAGNYRGFSLNYTATKDPCGGELSGVSGEFKSTGYPIPNGRSRYCDWMITVPDGSQVVVEILDLDLNSMDASSDFYLAFYNDKGSTSRIAYLKTSPVGQKIYSTTNMMRIAYWFGVGHRGFKARFDAVAPAPCGGVIEETSGSLQPPLPPYNETSFYCLWKLRVPPAAIDPENRTEATLSVTISGSIGNYDSRSNACVYRLKYIRVNDGEENVGVACGNMTNEVYTVRSSSLVNTIDVLNGTFGPRISFDLKYKWQFCGGILTGPRHTIRAPVNVEYPRSCVWHAKYEDPGSAITLVFNRMNMGSCDKGFIIVRNGGPLSPQIGKFCGNIKPHNITSSMNQLWIEYWAEGPPGDFEIQLDLVSRSCGGVIRGSNNEFMSPGFPKQYPNNAECTWEITAPTGYSVGLYFVNRFSLETSNSCENDFVQIFDWEWDKNGMAFWKEGPKFCGRNTPTPFNATSNRMKILFRSNGAIQGDGFQARWEQNCGGVFEAKGRDQYIESPHYPNDYPRNEICNYTINAPKNKELWIKFLDFEIEGRRSYCKFDNVTIISHPYHHGYNRETVWCGKNMPPLMNSLETINIIFMTDLYVQRRGFRFKYYMNECGGEITEPTMISPPSMSETEYYGRLNCTWLIRAPQGKSVVLRLEKFNVEMSHRCVYDRVMVFEGDNVATGKSLARLCGNITDLFPIKSAGNLMTVVFRSDASNHYGSMSAAVVFTNNESSGCGGKVNLTKSETFRSQRAASYDSYEDCHWRVFAGRGKNVKLTITRMDLKNRNGSRVNANGDCTGDYLEVRDGGGPLGDLIGRYCGNVIPPAITTSTDSMWIRFFTDDTFEGEGVIGTLEPVESPCGPSDWEINETKVFKSPNYPADFPAGIQCSWIFRSPDRFRKLRIHIEDLDMEDTEKCDGDHLEIKDHARKFISEDFGEDFVYNGNSALRRGPMRLHRFGGDATYKYCGKAKSLDYYSTNDQLRVTLKSSEAHMPKPRKFKLDVSKTSCNRNYTSPQGRILHEDVHECWTTITALPNHTISLYFNDFSFYDANNCENNWVKVHDGDFSAPVMKTLCGFMDPVPVFSTGNKLSIHAKTHSELNHGHERYDILYTTTEKGRGCGGKLFNYAGLFTSPMYPSNYRNESTCIWEISVPRGYQVALRFGVFDIGTSDSCETDHVSVAEDFPGGGRFEMYCPGPIPAIFRASGNSVKVTYQSSVNNAGTGWLIRFIAVQSTDQLDLLPVRPIPSIAFDHGRMSVPRIG
ncbi:cubilin-like [Venturia canescens]|uniref:cubilin-like n=1 Tax=Venturia canescens TaxID=32260 RepID=UPI001C9CDC7D|nr:cubilin-like [Venturia canescens]